MQENKEDTETAQTKEQGDVLKTKSYSERCPKIPLSQIASIVYRCIVLGGVATIIILSLRLRQEQIYLEDILLNGGSAETMSPLVIPNQDFDDFVVYNPSCEIPDYRAFHKSVKPYYWKMHPISCSTKPLLTSVTRSGSSFAYILSLNTGYFSNYVKNNSEPVCCYSTVLINNSNYTVGPCQILQTNVTLLASADLVHVNCKDDLNRTIYKINHFLVPIKSEARQKIERFIVDDNSSDDFLSVMIVGIHSVSRLNMLRNMPATVRYMEDNRWFTFPGYHSIQRSTFHNLIGPVLTGYRGNQLEETCWSDESNHSDSCPYIWKNYSEKHYITAFGEDSPKQDAFRHWSFDGFDNQPADYYLRPHMAHTRMEVGSRWDVQNCMGPKESVDYVLDFAADFASTYVKYPTFSLFWLTAADGQLNYPQALDLKLVEYFGNLEKSGALNRSMVVFFSDHGLRKTKFRTTYMGWVEAAMPFLLIWLPEWFRNKYPEKVKNFERNRYRLASHFDLHLTLMDALGLKARAAGCPKCVSLFDPVPWHRSCSDAGISIDSCACEAYAKVPVSDPTIKQLAVLVAQRINALADSYEKYLQGGYKCSNVTIMEVKSARRQVLNRTFGRKYVIYVVTDPNGDEFEAVVLGDTYEVKSIVEYTPYEERSFCMNSQAGKMWCVCSKL